MAKTKKSFNFEQALGELEMLVAAMETGDMSLEESLLAFEQGIRLTRECQEALGQAEQKVQLLLSDSGAVGPFEADTVESEGTA